MHRKTLSAQKRGALRQRNECRILKNMADLLASARSWSFVDSTSNGLIEESNS